MNDPAGKASVLRTREIVSGKPVLPPGRAVAFCAGSFIGPCGSGATFDRTRTYRYALWRIWDSARPAVAFVMLNPSTADAGRDDPTIRRCAGFARAWGFGGFHVVNLFAFRATRPADLKRAADPIGPRNDAHVCAAARRAGALVFAWGNHGAQNGRDRAVARALAAVGTPAFCLGRTERAQPRHPLYVRADAPLVPFQERLSCSA